MVELDFSHRAELQEQMDGPCSYDELQRCLRHLAIVNRLTLAHEHTLRWLERVFRKPTSLQDVGHPSSSGVPHVSERHGLKLVDIGCGYGDMLRRIEGWAHTRGMPLELIGLDINPNAIRAAREATPPGSRIRWVLGDALTAPDVQEIDLVVSCGVLHHLPEDDIVQLLAWMDRHARVGWYITDLHRKPTPYRVFDLIMRGPWWQRFIRPDGLRSIRRSFLAEDWQRMCLAAGLNLRDVQIEERRPARLCVGSFKQ